MRFYHSSTDAWQAMSQACTKAQKSIDFEEYILRDDVVGNQLLDIFMIKAREGVRVRLLLDAFGCRRLRRNSVIADLYEAGVQLAFFRPLSFIQTIIPTLGLPRSHAKALHIDGRASFIGSMCVAAHMLGWRDTLVALEGDVAIRAKEDFDREWCREVLNFSYPPPLTVSGTNSPQSQSYTDDYAAQIPAFAIATILDSLKARIRTAKTSVLIATPYFFPTGCLRDALIAAHDCGVSVTLMLASQTDIPLADTVTRGLIQDWRKLGFEVIFYQPGVLHAKYAIIDDDWATLGSCNFDLLSLKFNREANVILGEPRHVQELVRQSKKDRANCATSPASKSLALSGAQDVCDKAVGKFGALVCRLF